MRSTEQSLRRSKLDHNRDAVKLAAMLDLITLIAPLGTATPGTSPRAGVVHCPDLALFPQTANKLRRLATSRDDDEQLRESMAQALALIEDAWATLPSAISAPEPAAPAGPLTSLRALFKHRAGSGSPQVIHPLSPREREEALAKLRALHATFTPSPKRAAKDRHHTAV